MKFQIYGIGDNGVKIKLSTFTVDTGESEISAIGYMLRSQVKQLLMKRLERRQVNGTTSKEANEEFTDSR